MGGFATLWGLGESFGRLWGVIGRLWAPLGGLGGVLGASWGALGAPEVDVGVIMGDIFDQKSVFLGIVVVDDSSAALFC
mgnify:CR=1 FL=1